MAEMPMQEGAPAEQGQEAGGEEGQFQQLVGNLMKGMTILAEGLGQSNPEAAQGIGDLMSQFEGIIGSVLQGGGAQEGGPQKSRAVPVQESQGKPVGPSGV